MTPSRHPATIRNGLRRFRIILWKSYLKPRIYLRSKPHKPCRKFSYASASRWVGVSRGRGQRAEGSGQWAVGSGQWAVGSEDCLSFRPVGQEHYVTNKEQSSANCRLPLPTADCPLPTIFIDALCKSGPRTRVPRLWLLHLSPDQVHGSPSREPLLNSTSINNRRCVLKGCSRTRRDHNLG